MDEGNNVREEEYRGIFQHQETAAVNVGGRVLAVVGIARVVLLFFCHLIWSFYLLGVGKESLGFNTCIRYMEFQDDGVFLYFEALIDDKFEETGQ